MGKTPKTKKSNVQSKSSKKNKKYSEQKEELSTSQHFHAPQKNLQHRNHNGNDDDWIESLVKQVSSSDKLCSTSKSQRIEKRKVKKMERMQRMKMKKQLRDVRKSKLADHQKKVNNGVVERLGRIGQMCKNASEQYMRINRQKCPEKSTLLEDLLRARYQKMKITDSAIQPQKGSYGGIGLARSTYYLPFDDPSFRAKLEEEFFEHIDGFYGKQRTKAMKKQLDKDMLWKRLLREKKGILDEKGMKLSSDLKVKAMIDAGDSLM
mmetsp:Transcript_16796/g.26203  ORF Transcript_16796/g.26203 Transcript_16796/m.26203 type:complete len:264 (-) Transcript_16796:1329-2120(-)